MKKSGGRSHPASRPEAEPGATHRGSAFFAFSRFLPKAT